MKPWQDEHLQSLATAGSAQELFTELVKLVREEGFDLCSYGIRPPFPITQPRIQVYDNFPQAWHEQYRRQGYVQIDPTVRHGLRSLLPLVWTDDVFAEARDFWEDARGQGLRYGWAQPCRDPSGVAGMLTVARSSEPLTEAELQLKVPRLVWLTQVAHVSMTKLVIKSVMPEVELRFSAREISVMRWTAEGKTSGEIAEILGISERTVNFHTQNVTAKLNASNKTAAAIRLAVMGLLQ
ncbi:MAG: LuxR family transcriptional regulator [Pseudomonadota bacterium]|jgi:LuxR family transcriptional regulator